MGTIPPKPLPQPLTRARGRCSAPIGLGMSDPELQPDESAEAAQPESEDTEASDTEASDTEAMPEE